jgi:hypothetical protein
MVCRLLLLLLLALLPCAAAWLAPIVAKGNKLFDSDTGVEFRIKGMAYYPRPNSGEMAGVSNYDWASDEHEDVWKPHLEVMKDLGVNTVRLYSVDPSRSHDKFMCACSQAGIYVAVGMAAPCTGCSVADVAAPKCYPDDMFTRMQMVYNAFAVYDNTLIFSVANEPNLISVDGDTGEAVMPCIKAMIRDIRDYADSCVGSLREVPIGVEMADIPPRAQWLQYFDCTSSNGSASSSGDATERAQWMGFNPYVECDPTGHTEYSQSTGLVTLMKDYKEAGYPNPIVFGEFGCQTGDNTIDGYENQRMFYDVWALLWFRGRRKLTGFLCCGSGQVDERRAGHDGRDRGRQRLRVLDRDCQPRGSEKCVWYRVFFSSWFLSSPLFFS